MTETRPSYYDSFRCLAGACPDSCCKEWDVDVDDASAARYRSLSGELGEKLRSVLKDTPDGVQMAAEDGRCPMWRPDGLCRIQAELGEEALCHVCAAFPRLRHDYGDFVELGLELSCPEAARLILNAPAAPPLTRQRDGGEAGDYDDADMDVLKKSRIFVLEMLETQPPADALTGLLFYAAGVQQWLDTGEELPFSLPDALETAEEVAQEPDYDAFFSLFRGLEILTDRWATLLASPCPKAMPGETTALARYLVERYWLQAVSDLDLMGRAKFVVAACLLLGALPGNYLENAQLFSKEIENDADNLDALLDLSYTAPAFSDTHLLGMLRKANPA